MESFILGPSPKIDFSCSASTTHLQWLERQISSNNLKNNSLSSNGIQYRILAVLNAQGPLFIGWGFKWVIAVICTDVVWTVNLSRSDEQLCDQNFWDFRWKSFLFESHVRTVRHCRSDGRMSTSSNFHITLSCVRTIRDGRPDGWSSTCNFHICGARVRTMIGRHLDGWSWIHNFHIRCTRARTMADWSPEGWIWIPILALRRSASERESTSSGRLHQSSHNWTWKESEAWSNTERRPDGLLRRPDGCKLEQKLLDAVKGPDENLRRLDEWCLVCLGVRTVWHVVWWVPNIVYLDPLIYIS
jgi:hypothetical protein